MSTDTAALGSASLLPRHLAVLLLATVATLFAGNHVAARLAFDEGTGLLLAVLVRSAAALVVLMALFLWQGKRLALPAGSRPWQLLAGLMVAIQSLCLYSAVARIPVVVALLLMNTFPIQLALITWALGGPRPTLRAALIMAAILVGLVVVLDVPTWLASPATLGPAWLPGVAFGLGAATAFSVALWVTEHHLGQVGSTLRSLLTMLTVFVVMLVAGTLQLVPGGMALPGSGSGWAALVALALLYSVAFSVLFISVPRLEMARNAPVMNVEPVASLLLGYLVLGQMLSVTQLVGGAIVLGGIVVLSLSPR
ncbi:DMT family transporter [Halomonas sp. MCCC 1A17488]|uniref:DMT family transporter n=1 Tax=Billgrantia sulfidoxydans TaxID=2733484 RepID=A0ABX7W1H7_9GAMM|nr:MULTISPECIES: DMT family transporter [Halomonas]MCE8016036.1 DMT family transporter [Halomonas sp. MCCC 1A17488]MCG3239369.1 DMT family transporter [Halomonas sp. MCCC 1A17488]QPP50701.1 DMT family transporter [Halomonas sp. SS10-MC5]QTP54278.1 DMT family transporter [Halomonas sulfidoxydans]